MSRARSWIHSNSLVIILLLACTTDKTKLWLSLSEKQHQDPCPRPPPMYQDLSMCNDWPFIAKFVVSVMVKGTNNGLIEWLINCFIDWSGDYVISWSVDWLGSLFVVFQDDWFIDWLTEYSKNICFSRNGFLEYPVFSQKKNRGSWDLYSRKMLNLLWQVQMHITYTSSKPYRLSCQSLLSNLSLYLLDWKAVDTESLKWTSKDSL